MKCDHVVVVLVVDADPDARLPAGLRAVQGAGGGALGGQGAPDAHGGVPVRKGKSQDALGRRLLDEFHANPLNCYRTGKQDELHAVPTMIACSLWVRS